MTDRIRTLTVYLDHDCRDDDAEDYVNAIGLMRGVQRVELGPVQTSADYTAREVAKIDLRLALINILAPEGKDGV